MVLNYRITVFLRTVYHIIELEFYDESSLAQYIELYLFISILFFRESKVGQLALLSGEYFFPWERLIWCKYAKSKFSDSKVGGGGGGESTLGGQADSVSF